MLVTLYTQPLCPFCDLMKSMLDEAGIRYKVTDIKSNKTALEFIRNEGHKTVPQLYLGEVHLNKKPDTRDYTPNELYNIVNAARSEAWNWQDSGIENF